MCYLQEEIMGLFNLKEINSIKFKTQGIPHNAGITVEKAKTILREGEIRGKVLTPKQRGLFGARASGQKLRK